MAEPLTSLPEPTLLDLDEVPTAVIHAVVPMAEIAAFFDGAFQELPAALADQGAAPTGAAFARYAGPPGHTVDVAVGFPVDRPVNRAGRVEPSTLPAGRTAHLVHLGSFDDLGQSWGRLGAWIAAQGLTPSADLWEVYVTEPSPDMDPADLRTDLFWSVS